jgi:hypothetical protein
VLKNEEGEKKFSVNGSFLTGVKIVVDERQIQLTPAVKWYEYALAVFSVVFLIVWSSVPALVSIVPIIGGAIGGAIYATMAIVSILLMKKTSKVWMKLLIWFVAFLLMIGLGYLVALMVLSLL